MFYGILFYGMLKCNFDLILNPLSKLIFYVLNMCSPAPMPAEGTSYTAMCVWDFHFNDKLFWQHYRKYGSPFKDANIFLLERVEI